MTDGTTNTKISQYRDDGQALVAITDLRLAKRLVVCAACLYDNGLMLVGARHYDTVMQAQLARFNGIELGKPLQGFIDQRGVFMTREEAYQVAHYAGQLNLFRMKTGSTHVPMLFSEDLY